MSVRSQSERGATSYSAFPLFPSSHKATMPSSRVIVLCALLGAVSAWNFCSKGPHKYSNCGGSKGCSGQCYERQAKYGCAHARGGDGNDCYCSTEPFLNGTGDCPGDTVANCTIRDYCPPTSTGGLCAVGAVEAPVASCGDCYHVCGEHAMHYACWHKELKHCHCTEIECIQKSVLKNGIPKDPPCGYVPTFCPCDTKNGWERCEH